MIAMGDRPSIYTPDELMLGPSVDRRTENATDRDGDDDGATDDPWRCALPELRKMRCFREIGENGTAMSGKIVCSVSQRYQSGCKVATRLPIEHEMELGCDASFGKVF